MDKVLLVLNHGHLLHTVVVCGHFGGYKSKAAMTEIA